MISCSVYFAGAEQARMYDNCEYRAINWLFSQRDWQNCQSRMALDAIKLFVSAQDVIPPRSDLHGKDTGGHKTRVLS